MEKEMLAMPDTVASSLWLSLVDISVVFAVLTLLMAICYGLKFFSRDLLIEGSAIEDRESMVDVAAGDEPASEIPMLPSASHGEGSEPAEATAVPPQPRSTVSSESSLQGVNPVPPSGMRAFRITVAGKVFEVEVDRAMDDPPAVESASLPSAPPPIVAPAAPQTARPPAPPAAATSDKARGTSSPALMKSPLPGKVLKVVAAAGKAYKKGDTLMIIEAMKMENEILAPRDCVVAEVFVAVNQAVKTGDPLLRME
ncbi:MAG: biotin/lipoyl-containing protein [Candidatus Cryosericum sp.]